MVGCPKVTKQSQPLVGRSSPCCDDIEEILLLSVFFRLSIHAIVAKIYHSSNGGGSARKQEEALRIGSSKARYTLLVLVTRRYPGVLRVIMSSLSITGRSRLSTVRADGCPKALPCDGARLFANTAGGRGCSVHTAVDTARIDGRSKYACIQPCLRPVNTAREHG